MKTLNVILAVLVSLLLGLLVFEGGLRLAGFAPPHTINTFDPDLGWSKKPGAVARKSSREYDITIEINGLGLREDASMTSPAKPANTFRVVMIGDSFTLGFTVDRQDLFVDMLEGWWTGENRRVDVVNAGTEGWSTDQEAVWLDVHGKDFAPDLVIAFPYENDIYWNGQKSYTNIPKPIYTPGGTLVRDHVTDPGRKPFWKHLALGRFYEVLIRPILLGANNPLLFLPPGSRRPILKEQAVLLNDTPDFITEAMDHTRGALLAMKRTCAALGAKLVLAPIPSHAAIDPDFAETFGRRVLGLPRDAWSPDRPVDFFLEAAREVSIPALDARPHLLAEAAKGQDLYHQIDWHFNPAGNRAFATFLHDALDEMGVFPETHSRLAAAGIPPPPPETGSSTWIRVWLVLWVLLTALYMLFYRDEPLWRPPLEVGGLLATIFSIFFGIDWTMSHVPPLAGTLFLLCFVVGILTFLAYKMGRKVGTILELLKSFTLRGHWYLMPLVTVLLTIGSLLVVAASSPFIAPFIYTLF